MNLSVICGELGQDLGDLDAGHLGVDRLEGAADVVGDVLLGVPEVEVAGPALEVDHDDALGLAPARAAAGAAATSARGRGGLELEHRAEAQAQQARAPHAEDVAPGDPEVRIAEVFPGLSGDDDHRVAPGKGVGGFGENS